LVRASSVRASWVACRSCEEGKAGVWSEKRGGARGGARGRHLCQLGAEACDFGLEELGLRGGVHGAGKGAGG
jgi:hypothetical protein